MKNKHNSHKILSRLAIDGQCNSFEIHNLHASFNICIDFGQDINISFAIMDNQLKMIIVHQAFGS